MAKVNYESQEFRRMVEWMTEELEPFIKIDLLPPYANAYFQLALEPGGLTHTRRIIGENTTSTQSIRAEDLENFGNITVLLIEKFGAQLWMADKPTKFKEHGHIMSIRQTLGGNLKYRW